VKCPSASLCSPENTFCPSVCPACRNAVGCNKCP
jgi:hypothetical protein